jgi:hypothetical protein
MFLELSRIPYTSPELMAFIPLLGLNFNPFLALTIHAFLGSLRFSASCHRHFAWVATFNNKPNSQDQSTVTPLTRSFFDVLSMDFPAKPLRQHFSCQPVAVLVPMAGTESIF